MLAGVMEKKPKKKVEMTVEVEEHEADSPPSPSPGGGGTTPHDQLREFFNEIDTDGSGFLDRAEVKALQPASEALDQVDEVEWTKNDG